MRAMLIAVLVAGACSSPAQACFSPAHSSRLLLTTLPAESSAQPVVARVQVESVESGLGLRAKVRVVEAIRGVERGQSFTVQLRQSHMCVIHIGRHNVGRRYYIAGSRDAAGLFRGSWTFDRRVD